MSAYEQSAGPDHPATAGARAQLCFELTALDKADEAQPLCDRAVTALARAPAPLRTMEPVYRLWLAYAHQKLGQFERAGALLEEVRPSIDGRLGGPQAKVLLDSLSIAVAAARRN